MKEYNNVQSTIKPKEIEIDEYSVWKNTDIHEVQVEDKENAHTVFEFNQMQYSKDEYIQLLDERNNSLADNLTDTQMALCEIYESFVTANTI